MVALGDGLALADGLPLPGADAPGEALAVPEAVVAEGLGEADGDEAEPAGHDGDDEGDAFVDVEGEAVVDPDPYGDGDPEAVGDCPCDGVTRNAATSAASRAAVAMRVQTVTTLDAQLES